MVIETERLRLRRLASDDAAFILRLLNEPSFIENISDKGARTLDDAVSYILNGPVASYERFGFGLYLVELKETGASIGMCGLLKRDTLDDADIGYAYLPEFWSKGYALEAATAVMHDARDRLGLKRVVAITSLDNQSSIRVLEKIGFRYEGLIKLPGSEEQIKLFVRED